MNRWYVFAAVLAFAVPALGQNFHLEAGDGKQWFKGNTHTHTLWSDGDAAPEVVVDWYKEHGYDFLALSDHNIFLEGERWVPVQEDFYLDEERLQEIIDRFGEDWPDVENSGDRKRMRLKTLSELKEHFEASGDFILIPAEEVTSPVVHINAINIQEKIEPARPQEVDRVNVQLMKDNFDAIEEQGRRLGIPVFAHLNHPNWSDGITAEDIIEVGGERFFEVYNGHGGVKNWGRETEHKQSTDRLWDIILSMRLKQGDTSSPMYGLATDDSHNYFEQRIGLANSGRGWIQVLTNELTPNAIVQAVKDGAFYGSSGVNLTEVRAGEDGYQVHIDAEDGVTYTTEFFGTRKGFDSTSEPVLDAAGNPIPWATRIYSDDIGVVLATTTDNPAVYEPTGDELYVRARVTSSKLQDNPFAEGDYEMAWTQPYVAE